MKKLIVCSAMMVSLVAFAGSAEPDGTDFVVTAAAGESFTNSAAIGDYARLVKRGAGEVVLTAATTAFKGATVVEAGTLAITSLKALGSGTPVTVENGATFWIRTPHAGGQGDPLFTGHDMTISGKGVDNKGAIRYTQTSGGACADNMFSKITLADDATIEVASRWGMFNNTYPLDLAGHTLTRVGGSLWMIFNHVKSTGGPGTIVSTAGTMTFQNDLIIDENVTVVVTNGASTLGLWGTYATSKVKGQIKVYTGRTIQGQSSADATRNHLGPVHAAGEPAKTVELSTTYNNGNRSLAIDGPLTCDDGVILSKTYMRASGGQIFLTNNSSRVCRFVAQDNVTITQSRGSFLMRMMRISQSAGAQFRQTGGIMAVPSYDGGRIGEFSGTRGYYTLEGGEFHASNTLYLAEPPDGRPLRDEELRRQRGLAGRLWRQRTLRADGRHERHAGLEHFPEWRIPDGHERLERGDGLRHGDAVPHDAYHVWREGQRLHEHLQHEGRRGRQGQPVQEAADLRPRHARLRQRGRRDADADLRVGMDRGRRRRLRAQPGPFRRVEEGPGVRHVRELGQFRHGEHGNPVLVRVAHGQGRGERGAADGLGIARVVFEDATGWGASAYAEYDFSTKKVTKIVVTSRGCDYSDGTKAYLESPDRTTRYECALTLSSNEGMCGEFVKRGAPELRLYATNTITGGIAVESGSLVTYTGGVIPSNTPVRVESGATLNLYNKGNIAVSTFTGAGQVINGAVTVTNAVRASCAELFAGKHATFAGNLTFAPGATFTITDPENLAAYAHSASATAFTAASVNGTPTLAFEGDAPQGVKWSLFKKNATTYNFGPVIGTMLLLK